MQNWFKARAAVRRFADDQGGAVIVFAAAAIFMIMGIGALAIDMGYSYAVRTRLQTTADAAALAAVAQISDQTAATSTALAFAESNMQAVHFGAVIQTSDVDFGTWNASTGTFDTTGTPANSIRVTAQLSGARGNASPLFFANIFGLGDLDQSVTAIATEASVSAPCFLALEPSQPNVLEVNSHAQITANGCGIQVNSSNSQALYLDSNANITANDICVTGGYQTHSNSSTNPTPTTGCSVNPDPLASMVPPPESNNACAFNNLNYSSNSVVTLDPGVYCGTTSFDSNVNVTLNPGTYVFRGGPLDLSSNVTLTGTGVMIYLMNNAYLDFDSNTNVALSAPTTGPYTGILFFGSRSDQVTHYFASNSGSIFNGTVYFPTGALEMSSNSQIANGSDYTMFIVRTAHLDSNAHLVINSNYAASSVPLPAGFITAGGLVR